MKIYRRFLFTRSELRGIIGLSFSIVVLRVLMFYLPYAGPLPDAPVPESPREKKNDEKEFPRNDQQQFRKSGLPAKKQNGLIEVNSADTLLLCDLPGIGPSFAKRIVKYRDMLGGYFRLEQLLEVYGMDSARLAGFSNGIRIDTSRLVKMDINQLTFKELLKHPYLEFEHVKAICNYREKHGLFGIPAELWTAGVLPDSLREMLSPYLKTK